MLPKIVKELGSGSLSSKPCPYCGCPSAVPQAFIQLDIVPILPNPVKNKLSLF
jgi:hypothetical protein